MTELRRIVPAREPSQALPLRRIASQAKRLKVAIIDLNNFATFPTLAVGLLVASLRNEGHEVELVCPLAHDMPGTVRERRETLWDHLRRRLSLATHPTAAAGASVLRRAWRAQDGRAHPAVVREAGRLLAGRPDAILLSAYLQHHPSVRVIARRAKAAGVPLILGGPMFNVKGIAEAWRTIPGVTAIYGGEADLTVAQVIEALLGRGESPLLPGVTLPDGRRGPPAPPLRPLDATPTPDFTDFPWDRYPKRIVPVMTGRGCQWNKCVFCSDIVSANGRSFRTRSVDSVLIEMREQARRHNALHFVFLDLKLNSNPAMLRGLAEGVQLYVPGAEWIGTVHVDLRKDNGLSRRDLKAAVAGGMRRISFGLETGSQRLLDRMAKGSSVEANGAFIRNAFEAGLSVRCTMFSGFPGETAEDLAATADFLEAHNGFLDRIRFNGFAIIEDTEIFEAMRERPHEWPELQMSAFRPFEGRGRGRLAGAADRHYRRQHARVLRAVHEINRRPIRSLARHFDGLM